MLNLDNLLIDSKYPLLSNNSNDEYLISLYTFLRKNNPVYWSEYHNSWIVTKYKDVCDGLKNTHLYSCRDTQSIVTRDLVTQTYDNKKIELEKKLDIEEPREYLIYRKMVLDYYNFIISSGLQKEISSNIQMLFTKAPKNKEIDIISNITDLIPAMTVCYMLGFDYSKVYEIHEIAQKFCRPASASDRLDDYRSAVKYLYKEQPGIFNIKDTKILNSEYSQDFIIRICLGLFIGGSISMTGALPGLLYHSKIYEDEFKKVIKNNKLIDNFIQESLRHSFKMSHLVRTSIKDHYVNNTLIKKFDKVAFIMSSANYDEDIFGKDSQIFKINRNYKKINLVFGNGTYRCIGQKIAVIQLQEFVKFLLNNKIEVLNTDFKKLRDFTGTTYEKMVGVVYD